MDMESKMVIKPKIRGFICTNAHPIGCAEHVKEQIAYVKSQGEIKNGPKNVLVIGASTGYGLASRITLATPLWHLCFCCCAFFGIFNFRPYWVLSGLQTFSSLG